MAELIQGFGGVKFMSSTETLDAEFTTGYGTITYTPKFLRYENVDYELIQRFLGYRVSIEVNIYNFKDTDYIQMQNLFRIINSTISETGTGYLIIFPKYDVAQTGNLYFEAIPDSEVKLISIARVKIGQTLKLKFIVPDLKHLTTSTGNLDLANWVDESNNKMVDQNGNYLILKQN